MKQRYDLVAFALLTFSCVFLIAIIQSPKEFKVSDWQPLMAAVLTLGGAGMVYRGTTLAYRAAMAKLDLDREAESTKQRRKMRGLLLRLQYANLSNYREAISIQDGLRPIWTPEQRIARIRKIDFKASALIDEAWDNLDILPRSFAQILLRLKIAFRNIEDAQAFFEGNHGGIPNFTADAQTIEIVRNALEIIHVESRSFDNKAQIVLADLDTLSVHAASSE